MIVTRLIGGLGNQMFQYACGLYLATRTQQTLYLDVSAFDTYKLHDLAIDNLSISARRLPESERQRIPGRHRGVSRIREKLESLVGRSLELRREKPFGFREEYTVPGRDLYLDGYWQSEQFFPAMRKQLKDEFQPVKPLSSQTCRVADEIQKSHSVAVHVRRGDYVTDSEAKRIYRSLEADYYRTCLQDLRLHVEDARIFLFSNDVQWCLSNLDVGVPFTPVTHNGASTAFEDMYLMSRCQHAVTANSSFSWWGAFLGQEKTGRRVYYPDPWFNPGTLDGTALGCDEWISESDIITTAGRAAA